MKKSKLEKGLHFFMECSMSPVTLMQIIKSKSVRWIVAIPLLFCSLVTLAIFGIPILLLILADSTEKIVNNDF